MAKIEKGEGNLISQVRVAIGTERLAALAEQPPVLAAGGMDTILERACAESEGREEKQVMGAAVRVIQLCGSVPTINDINTWSEL